MSDHNFESELAQPTPRRVHYGSLTQLFRFCFVVVWVGAALIMLFLAFREVGDLKALAREGRTIQAQVTDKRESKGKGTSYILHYSYEVNGTPTYDDETVSSSEYQNTSIGSSLSVTYLPSHPHVHRVGIVGNNKISEAETNWVIGFLVIMTILTLIFGYFELSYRTQRYLAEYGVPVAARILECTPPPKLARDRRYTIRYQIALPNATQENTVQTSEDIANSLQTGTSATALYDPQHPEDSILYIMLNTVEFESA